VIALLLATADAALVLLGADGTLRLGHAPLHALAMGFFGGLLFAMATRVICGHGASGRADRYVWVLFWVLQGAVLLRLAASVWPPHSALLSAARRGHLVRGLDALVSAPSADPAPAAPRWAPRLTVPSFRPAIVRVVTPP